MDFPDDFDENDKQDGNDADKVRCKSGESIHSASWSNPNERDIEDLKK